MELRLGRLAALERLKIEQEYEQIQRTINDLLKLIGTPTKVLDTIREEKMLTKGVQTDGSSVVLPRIANLNNAKVDIIPDLSVNWYVDHNLKHPDFVTGLPMGTLRIPSFLLHNDTMEVGSRVALRNSIEATTDRKSVV